MFKLKNIFAGCMLGAMLLATATSCNDDWNDEQYAHYVGFKAPLDTEGNSVGVTTVNVPFTRINEDGTPKYGEKGISHYQLPVVVSGSTLHPTDLTVNIAPSDTLPILNMERFATRTELYYKDMSQFAEYPSTLVVPANQTIGLLNIKFDFRGIDMVDRYLLPLTVKNGDGYERNPRKNYATAMLRVLPYTDYTGTYQATNLRFYVVTEGVTGNEPGGMETVQCYIVDENTVFFYAGTINEKSLIRKYFKIFAKFEPYEEGGTRGQVIFTCENPDLEFVQNKPATFTIIEQHDEVQNYIIRRTVVINDIDYNYTDYVSAPGSKITYNVNGTMSMERKLNTQMPLEDQIIFD